MFKLETFTNLVTPHVVKFEFDGVNGETVKAEFTAHFKILPDDQLNPLVSQGDRVLLKAVLTGWEGIEDENGTVEFNDESLAKLANLAFWRVQVINAYYECLAVCARKNLSRPQSSG